MPLLYVPNPLVIWAEQLRAVETYFPFDGRITLIRTLSVGCWYDNS